MSRARVWRGALRSFLGHLQVLSAKGYPSLDLGPASLLFPDGSTLEAPYTTARAVGTEALRAKYPWVDTADIHLFLMGFDAAAKLHSHTTDTETGRQIPLA